jgi:ATP-dependent protease ClpP protease subunit
MIRATIIAFMLYASAAFANISFDNTTKVLTISGATTRVQSLAVWKLLNEEDVRTVVLSGEGGDFYAGIYIGRQLKKHNVTIVVPKGAECISACAFIAMADKDLVLDGSLLFHVPYRKIMYTNKTMLETAQEYGVAYFDMATYLVEMGAAIPFGKQLLARTTVCKFFTITEASQFNKLLSPEEPTSHVWVKHNMTDKCELMKLRRQLSIGR